MKHFNKIFRVFAVVILMILTTAKIYCQNIVQNNSNDSISISLLTCSPGDEIWAQYGHTAIRIQDKSKGMDVVINYGMFSSSQPYFIPRFILGLTDYKVDIQSFNDFRNEYTYENRTVTQQTLNLNFNDKIRIINAIEDNLRPENQTYRYNFFYDNCTSRARDIIVNNLSGKLRYQRPAIKNCSFRDMIHFWNGRPWAITGEDILLGVNADRNTTKAEQQFLPENLKIDFELATYKGKPFVTSTNLLVNPDVYIARSNVFPDPGICGIIIIIITVIITVLEKRKNIIYWGYDLVLMIISGLIGTILTIMIFSQHPCVNINFLMFFFNPLSLIFAWSAVKHTREHKKFWYWKVAGRLCIIGFVAAFFQSEPSLMLDLALCLLVRIAMHLRQQRNYAVSSDKK